ncbi:MAG: hypothetical protein H0W83_10485, partial [Planctomycetes bacterium]|nr:hypothetical protein [Planctomycetota bacterium]
WERDGVAGEELSWSVGYGPRTQAWLLKPIGATGRLPGIAALHDHGGWKFHGKEKIALGPDAAPAELTRFHQGCYGGRAYANELARAGYAVLVHDTFQWGSRRFPFETIPEWDRLCAQAMVPLIGGEVPKEIADYNAAAGLHEHTVERYAVLLGTTMSAIIAFEDRIAANYLASRRDVDASRIGCVGLSGGGLRSTLLNATSDRIAAAVVVGLMSTYDGLLDHNVNSHTWMLYPSGWGKHGDWPDLAACRAPSPLLVQYDNEDGLFTLAGMKAAHRALGAHFKFVRAPKNYVGQFYPGPHKFDVPMQDAAIAWLGSHLKK